MLSPNRSNMQNTHNPIREACGHMYMRVYTYSKMLVIILGCLVCRWLLLYPSALVLKWNSTYHLALNPASQGHTGSLVMQPWHQSFLGLRAPHWVSSWPHHCQGWAGSPALHSIQHHNCQPLFFTHLSAKWCLSEERLWEQHSAQTVAIKYLLNQHLSAEKF